jgi:hypothetical protein
MRSEVDKKITSADVASQDITLDETRDGRAIAIDTALMWTIPVAMLPRITAIVENTGETHFKKSSSSLVGSKVVGAPAPMRQKVNFSLGFTPKITSLSKLNVNFEVRDAFRDTEDFYRLVYIGSELALPHLFKFRLGFNQGYLSYGLTLDFKYSKFEFASYGQELGAYAGQKEDTRYLVKYTMGF